MLIIPAIDLYQKKVVRLRKGDLAHSTVYSTDPVAMARQWESQGAELLHVVDLSSAFNEGDNISIISEIAKAVGITIEVGGGIRDIAKAEKLMSAGVSRVIIGTKALDEGFLDTLMAAIGPEHIALGVDALDGCLAVEGWKRQTNHRALDFIAFWQKRGIRWVIYTDISRDGTLEGLDFSQVESLASFKEMNIIASGGVGCLEDIKNLKQKAPFLYGVIAGKALYERKFTLKEAFGV